MKVLTVVWAIVGVITRMAAQPKKFFFQHIKPISCGVSIVVSSVGQFQTGVSKVSELFAYKSKFFIGVFNILYPNVKKRLSE